MRWNDGNGRWQQMHDQDGAGWLMVILMLVAVAAVVVLVVALLRGTIPAPGSTRARALPGSDGPDPRAILRERFARGEIDEQDFRLRMRALEDSDPTGP
jgi:putative membrane protein